MVVIFDIESLSVTVMATVPGRVLCVQCTHVPPDGCELDNDSETTW